MWVLLFFTILSVQFTATSSNRDLETLRQNYDRAIEDKELCQRMIKELESSAPSSVHLAYLGAFRAIWANHVFNPFAKLKTFNTGKADIESAVRKDPENVEIRFVRLSIQKNCPKFLGYNDNIEEDTLYLEKSRDTVTSPTLARMIDDLIKSK